MPYAESDLIHNRAGNLSPAQKAILQRTWQRMVKFGIGFVLFMLALGIFFYAIGDLAGLIFTWIFAGVIALVLGIAHFTMQKVRQGGGVVSVRGTVQREKELDETTYSYYLNVGDLRLTLHPDDYPKFEDGEHYTVYYVSQTRYVVSAEK